MSAAKTKLDLSLDDIIKNNKKDQKPGKRNVRNGPKRNAAGLRKKGQGILKRRSIGAQKSRGVMKRSNNKAVRVKGNAGGTAAVNKVATQRLVSKLVKKALKQVSTARPQVRSVRNVLRGRRGGVRNSGQVRGSLNRISQRSRVINRRSQNLNRTPIAALQTQGRRGSGIRRRGGRGNARIVMARREQNPIQAQLNFLRRQQQHPRQQIQAPVFQQPRRRPAPVRRQQAARVIYVQQQRPAPVRRQPQIIYVQQQPRRQFGRGRGGGGGGRRPQRSNNDPFFEPVNFLQRIPSSGQSFGRGRGGRRFIEF